MRQVVFLHVKRGEKVLRSQCQNLAKAVTINRIHTQLGTQVRNRLVRVVELNNTMSPRTLMLEFYAECQDMIRCHGKKTPAVFSADDHFTHTLSKDVTPPAVLNQVSIRAKDSRLEIAFRQR
ncbi:hypothetical protein PFI31113_02604 [Pandoraea fibrosis]|uniref:Uncharacterized protein n=1 Tax=Pandoraea fibrosis TaxID=1891094 RepID=A0A5E4VFC5_9BURK|nr:hypothetical protein PFI31113_02604 [Pandoraea fibrosis]